MKRFITMLIALIGVMSFCPPQVWAAVSGGEFYVKNVSTGKYLGFIGTSTSNGNFGIVEESKRLLCIISQPSSGTFNIKLQGFHYVSCGSNGGFSNNQSANPLQIFEVNGNTATKVTSIETGHQYLIVGDKSGTKYAIKSTDNGTSGNGRRVQSTAVTIASDQIDVTGFTDQIWEFVPETRENVEGIYLRTLAGDYYGIGTTTDNKTDNIMLSEPYAWNLNYISGTPKAYSIKSNSESKWINSGSNGYLSTADSKDNARPFYFYEATISGSTITGTLVEQPQAGKQYVVCVVNAHATTSYNGLYAMYGALASGMTNRVDVIKLSNDKNKIPDEIEITTSMSCSNGATTPIDLNKAVWQIKLPAKQVVTGTDDSVITEGWYQIQIGNGTGFQHPAYKDYYLAGFTRAYSGNNWQALVPDGDDLRTYVYISGSHDAFNIQYRKGGSGNLAPYYANFNATSTTTAPNNLHFIPSDDGTEWRIQGNGVQNWMGWNLGGPAVGGTSNAAYSDNYFKLIKINEFPEVVVPEVGKSYRIAILRSDGTKKYIKGTSVTDNASEADILTVGESGVEGYPMTFVTKSGDYLTNQGVRSGMSGNVIAFKGGTLGSANSSYVKCSDVIKAATYYLTAKARWNSASQEGNIILMESNNTYNNSAAPYMDGSFSSALLFEEITAPLVSVTYKYYLDGATEPVKTEVKEAQLSGQAPAAADFSSPFASVTDNHGELVVSEDGTTEVRVDVTQNLPFEVTTDPSAPKYGILRMQSNENRYGYVSEDGKAKCVTTYLSSENSRYLWYITGNVVEGFKLYSELGPMKATATQSTVDTEGEGTNWELRQGTAGVTMKTNLFSLYNEDVKYMNSRPAGDILYWTANDAGSTFQLIQDVEVSVSEAGYATFYYQYPVSVPEEVSAYTMTESDEYLSATKVTTVPVGVGVVLQAEQGKYTFPVAKATATTSSLSGTYTAKSSTEADGNYVFSIVNEHPGFYKFGGESLAANKAYYKPTVANVQGFVIDFDGITTAINAAEQTQSQKVSFDLQGRRVNKAVRGLFIQNGVKVIK